MCVFAFVDVHFFDVLKRYALHIHSLNVAAENSSLFVLYFGDCGCFLFFFSRQMIFGV